jgi:hypothetical protein
MATYLQAANGDEIALLRSEPERINRLDNEPDWSTHLMPSLNYFLTGDAYPSDQGPLGEALSGSESVACPTLETGSFDLVVPARAREVLEALRGVDPEEIRSAVEQADFDELVEEEELYELEIIPADEVADALLHDLEGLVRFYTEVVRLGVGVVIYTT